MDRGGDRRRRRHLGGRDRGARRDLPLGAGVREQGRGDGLLEPAPARADLGVEHACRASRPPRIGTSAPTSRRTRSPLLVDYARRERELSLRIVCENDAFLAVVPFWAIWPFETLHPPAPAGRAASPSSTPRSEAALAALLATLLGAYDRLFEVSFPVLDGLARRALRRRTSPTTTGSSTPTSTRRCCGRRR